MNTIVKRLLAWGKLDPHLISPGNLLFSFDSWGITGLNNGDAVGTWNDASGNGYHATQATAARKPIYAVEDGIPRVRFTAASSHWLALPNAALPAQNHTIFVVFKATSTAVQKALISRAYNFGALYLAVVANNDGTNPSKLRLVVDDSSSYSTSGADGAWVIGAVRYDSAENKVYLNGANEDTDANAAGAISYNANDAAAIGALRNTANAIASAFDGDMGQMLGFNGAFNDGQIRKVMRYLARRWRVSLTA